MNHIANLLSLCVVFQHLKSCMLLLIGNLILSCDIISKKKKMCDLSDSHCVVLYLSLARHVLFFPLTSRAGVMAVASGDSALCGRFVVVPETNKRLKISCVPVSWLFSCGLGESVSGKDTAFGVCIVQAFHSR